MNKLRYIITTLCLVIISVVAQAAVEIDGIWYEFWNDSGVECASVVRSQNSYVGDINIPQSVSYGGSLREVRTIEIAAFFDCSDLTSVNIPNTVTRIGAYAFYGCSGLSSILIPPNVTSIEMGAFQNCTELKKFACPKAANYKSPYQATISYDQNVDIVENGFVFGPNKRSIRFVPSTLTGEYSIPSSVTLIGDYAFSYCSSLTSVSIPSSVTTIGNSAFRGCSGLTSVSIPSSVTTIGNSAFSNCSGLTSVTIPSSITTISDYAFFYCHGLTTVSIPSSITTIGNGAFSGCSGLTTVNIPSSITTIGNSAFSGCSGLTSVSIPTSITTIGDYAFRGCSGLTSVTIPKSVTKIADYVFSDCSSLPTVTIPETVTSIGKNAFSNCSGLISILIPRDVRSIGANAFDGCTELKKLACPKTANYVSPYGETIIYDRSADLVENGFVFGLNKRIIRFVPCTLTGEFSIPSSITTIGKCAFYGCSGLTSVSIPSSVTTIGDYAFRGCSGLTSVSIPNSITTISDYAFYGCSGLTSVSIPSSITTIGNSAFYGCSGLTSVSIPNSITTISDYAFRGCSGLTSVIIPKSVTTIGNGAFSGCSGLTSVSIPNSITTISDYAFSGCGGLTSVSIHNSITTIGKHAFYGCSGLTSVTIPGSVTTIGNGAFSGCSGLIKTACPTTISDPFSYGIKIRYNPSEALVENDCVFDFHNWRILFAPCSLAGEYTMRASVFQIGDYAFYGCSSLTSVSTPISDISIGNYAFYGCDNLIGVYSKGPSDIGSYAFYGCSRLTQVNNDNRFSWIGGYALYGCRSLTEVTIESYVSSIGDNAFDGCSGINVIHCSGDNPPKCQSGTFADVSTTCKVFVPRNYIEAYRNAEGWTNLRILSEDNYKAEFTIPDLTVRVGEPLILPVAMTNHSTINSISCEIYLPTGILARRDKDGNIDVKLTKRGPDSYEFWGYATSYCPCNISIDSTCGESFRGTKGVVFNLELDTSNAQPGTYEVTSNFSARDENDKPIYPDPVIAKIVVKPSIQLGDVNVDDAVNVTDASLAMAHILKSDPVGFHVEYADMNGDGVVNVADVTDIVDRALSSTTASDSTLGATPEDISENGCLFFNNFDLTPGEVAEMPVLLRAPRCYGSFQTDIYLPDGVEFVSAGGESEKSYDVWLNPVCATDSHTIASRLQTNGALRVIAYSTTNALFKESSEDALFYVRVRANSNFSTHSQPVWFRGTIFNAGIEEFKTPDHSAYMNANISTGITDIEAVSEAVYYNLQGVRVNQPERGRMYIRVHNGNATKVVF